MRWLKSTNAPRVVFSFSFAADLSSIVILARLCGAWRKCYLAHNQSRKQYEAEPSAGHSRRRVCSRPTELRGVQNDRRRAQFSAGLSVDRACDRNRHLVAFESGSVLGGCRSDGRIMGSNFMDERNPIAGIGPIGV